jgi:hypothetical protein
MDKLHTVMRSIRGETKAGPDHLTVFREFLAHLDRIQTGARKSRKPAAAKPVRRKAARRAK